MERVSIRDRFWRGRIDQMAREVIPYQWNALNDNIPGAESSHAVENFKIAAGLANGKFYGERFQDSDVAKWLEAASYSLVSYPSPELEKVMDGVIDLIGRAQQEDGYLNTFFTVAQPENRWKDFSHGHELYCAGHMIEAAVAYYQATGKRKLLDIVCRYVDYIISVMGPEEGKRKVYCGHEEIELALVKLYRATGDEKHLRLSRYFIEERGKQPSFLAEEETFGWIFKDKWFGLDYHQAHAPVREQPHADGHAVRAMYLYAAMADLAAETGDSTLIDALGKVWQSVAGRRMYITGGIGSQGHAERFTFDYDLPNDVAYAETCASIGLVFWMHRMLRLEPNGAYADVMERALYNGVLSGISLDGTRYFYVNPLEVHPEAVRERADHKHVKPERVHWFGCACCPPNIARLLTSLGQYVYSTDVRGVYVHLYMENEAAITVGSHKVTIAQKTEYPWDGDVTLEVHPERECEFTVGLRIPGWCKAWMLMVNGTPVLEPDVARGYAMIRRAWKEGDVIRLLLPMPVERVKAHPLVRENAGKTALQRGPMVYCLEETDNGPNLAGISLSKSADIRTASWEDGPEGAVALEAEACRDDVAGWGQQLYRIGEFPAVPHRMRAVPYSMWGNRRPGEMAVWIRERG
ncbi:glycoside hydrolase family 127 protein [Cohnella caldifontis]|uniref:glycoside hydrolase family 127 protein n=1 Tax=Cohnella caldifontis TaxID=3027471 RepID=UPI0023EC7A12|nr:beta-L-arabinofuranosidase domain-containing protein [Cohnella sp. YIM B05605]